jgi:hypothetical protein
MKNADIEKQLELFERTRVMKTPKPRNQVTGSCGHVIMSSEDWYAFRLEAGICAFCAHLKGKIARD